MSGTGEYQLHLLGMFRLERGARVVKFPRRKAATLFAYLALHPHIHGRDELAALLWGDYPDDEARQSLSTALSTLRRELRDDVLVVDRESVRLNPTFPLWVDAVSFETYAKRFLAEPPFDLSTAFVDLYEGDLLPDVYEDWVVTEREHLRSLYLDVLLHITQQMRSRSEYERAVEFARRVLAIEPSNERAHQHIMFCCIAKGDRAAALKQYEECRSVLQSDLGVEPMPETTALYHWIMGQPAHVAAKEARITNLPLPLTSFVGREHETAEIKRALTEHRLVTLAGPGGSGKTRLAIQVATDLVDAYKDGVWFVDLAGVRSGALVAHAVAQALGVHPGSDQYIDEIILDTLRSRHTLLVWDNCEQVATGCAHLAHLILTSCPKVTILLTSRAPVGIDGEVRYAVPPLSVPADEAVLPTLARLAAYPASRLFIERATTTYPDVALVDRDAPAVAAVCRHLDGMPLAIELAAARVRVLSVSQIADHLHERLGLLTSGSRSAPPRQQSLRATIDWSYDLLDKDEQTMLRCLSVFVGGFSLAGATAIYGGGSDEGRVLDLLSRLVDKSMVSAGRNGDEARYRLLDTIKLYAWEKAIEAGEKSTLIERYVSYCGGLVSRDVPFINCPPNKGVSTYMAKLDTAHDDLRAALVWCRETGNVEPAVAILSAWDYWCRIDEASDLGDWVEILAQATLTTSALQLKALAEAGLLARASGDVARSFALAEKGLALARASGDKYLITRMANFAGRAALAQGEYSLAIEILGEVRSMARESSQTVYQYLLDYLAYAQMRLGDLDAALPNWQEALELSRASDYPRDHPFPTGSITMGLGHLYRLKQDYAAAARLYKEGLTCSINYQQETSVLDALAGLAAVAAEQGQAERAGLLWGAVDVARAAAPLHLPTEYEIDYTAEQARLRRQVGDVAFDQVFARGRAMTVEQAVAYALDGG